MVNMDESEKPISIFMGILALIVIIYRLIYIGYPIFEEGIRKREISQVLKSVTLLVQDIIPILISLISMDIFSKRP